MLGFSRETDKDQRQNNDQDDDDETETVCSQSAAAWLTRLS